MTEQRDVHFAYYRSMNMSGLLVLCPECGDQYGVVPFITTHGRHVIEPNAMECELCHKPSPRALRLEGKASP